MSMWHGAKARRVAGAALGAVALTVSLTACGSGADDGKGSGASGGDASASAPAEKTPAEGDSGPTAPDTSQTLATIDASDGFQFVIHTAERDNGGFLTINGTIKNTSGKRQAARLVWSGTEAQVQQTSRSLAGITLVDTVEKKRYYVLRDTDGNPLTTTSIDAFDPGAEAPFFAQFPAPPVSTTSVAIQIPGGSSATIELS